MEGFPFELIFIFIIIFVVAVIATLVRFFLRQRQLSRLESPHKDYLKKKTTPPRSKLGG